MNKFATDATIKMKMPFVDKIYLKWVRFFFKIFATDDFFDFIIENNQMTVDCC